MLENGGVARKGEVEKRVMVAIDESEYSYYALIWVLENLKDTIVKSRLVILAAKPSPTYNFSYAAQLGTARLYCPLSAAPDFVESIKEQEKQVTVGLLEKAKNICASRGVNAEIVTDDEDPRVAICKAVEKLNIDLLIVGNHGMGRIKRAIIGSVSSYCVLNAKCPVLVVKRPE